MPSGLRVLAAWEKDVAFALLCPPLGSENNAALQERKDAWSACKRHPHFYDPEWRQEHAQDYRVNYYDQANALPELKRERTDYARIGSHVLQETLKRVEKAFQGFFRRVQCGQTPGYPRYKSYKRYDSFCFPDHAGWKLTGNRLSISNLGTIKVKLHREVQGTIKTCTVKREGDNWYVVLTCVKDLSERTHICVHCGLVLDRDVNAAVNILRLGLSHQVAHVA